LARKFLYGVVLVVLVVIGTMLGLRFWARELSELAFVPRAKFSAPAALPASAWDDPRLWIGREVTGWLPQGVAHASPVDALVFYVHPTSLFDRRRWNAKLPDAGVDAQADRFAQAQASAFNLGEVWAPRYRQATMGAMLTAKSAGQKALAVALGDVRAAFAAFLAANGGRDGKRPIVLVGHSQGALLLMRLIQAEVAGTPLARRIAAAYVVGWPVGRERDLPGLGLPACSGPDEAGCVLSWMSFGEPADPAETLRIYRRDAGLDGRAHGDDPIVCTNPLTGGTGDATASANLGTLVPSPAGVALVPGLVPARCGPQGLLLVGPGPQVGADVMPGNNYHVYDIPLFWGNVRADMARRVAAWRRLHG
jgi:hypothetical protein